MLSDHRGARSGNGARRSPMQAGRRYHELSTTVTAFLSCGWRPRPRSRSNRAAAGYTSGRRRSFFRSALFRSTNGAVPVGRDEHSTARLYRTGLLGNLGARVARCSRVHCKGEAAAGGVRAARNQRPRHRTPRADVFQMSRAAASMADRTRRMVRSAAWRAHFACFARGLITAPLLTTFHRAMRLILARRSGARGLVAANAS